MLSGKFTQHDIPDLDTTSTADISFILLIFFLMTTSMTIDMGMRRRLPQMPVDKETPQVVKKENLMTVDVMADHVIRCDGNIVTMKQLGGYIAEFALDDNHVINIRTAGDAVYSDYFEIHQMISSIAHKKKIKITVAESELDNSAMQGGSIEDERKGNAI